MKRLTTIPQAALIKCCNCIEKQSCYGDISCNEIDKALERLRQYENTELEPENIKTAKVLAVQFLEQAIKENEKSVKKGCIDEIDVTAIRSANEELEKMLLKLTVGYTVNQNLRKEHAMEKVRSIFCLNNKCKNYFEDSCMKIFEDNTVRISENSQCEDFEIGRYIGYDCLGISNN